MSKNSTITDWRQLVIFILCALMIAALFLSRAMLASSMILFFFFSFFHRNIRGHLSSFLSSPLLWGMSLLFFIPLVSGWWSDDKQQWGNILRIKLPLLVMPLAFAGPIQLSRNQGLKLAMLFIVLITGGTVWSMFHYVTNISAVHEKYLHSQTIITPLDDDHVRFSWIVSVAALLAGWLLAGSELKNKFVFGALALIGVWLIVFLHILAVRTGLFSFYIIAIVTVLWLIYKRIKTTYSILLMSVIIALPVLAYFTLPTFQNRVKYFLYSLDYVKDANYLEGSNDAVRAISIKTGWEIMNNKPATGVGFGDLITETKKREQVTYPQMVESDRIYPSSEWIVYGAACGWAGFVLFTIVMAIPLFIAVKNKLPWQLLNVTAAFSFLFDIGLEVQFGVFIYSFIVLWWWRWIAQDAPDATQALSKEKT